MRQPWTVRVATWSARHRWPVVALWCVLTSGVGVACLAAGGTTTADAVDSGRGDETADESARADGGFSAGGTPGSRRASWSAPRRRRKHPRLRATSR